MRTIIKNPRALCDSIKTDNTAPGKMGRAVGIRTRASRAGVEFKMDL